MEKIKLKKSFEIENIVQSQKLVNITVETGDENVFILDENTFILKQNFLLASENVFLQCKTLQKINMENFNFSRVTTMKGWFFGCENLNFNKKKGNMVKGQYKKYNEMLSTLAYAKFSQIIESKCARNRIYLNKVNPAWTSYIAKMKYCNKMKLNIHTGASYVIARRGQGFKDKVNKKMK